MGVSKNVGFKEFPKQGSYFGKRVRVFRVCFNYEAQNQIGGVIVRDDVESPFQTIIKLDDQRYVLATECMYQLDINK